MAADHPFTFAFSGIPRSVPPLQDIQKDDMTMQEAHKSRKVMTKDLMAATAHSDRSCAVAASFYIGRSIRLAQRMGDLRIPLPSPTQLESFTTHEDKTGSINTAFHKMLNDLRRPGRGVFPEEPGMNPEAIKAWNGVADGAWSVSFTASRVKHCGCNEPWEHEWTRQLTYVPQPEDSEIGAFVGRIDSTIDVCKAFFEDHNTGVTCKKCKKSIGRMHVVYDRLPPFLMVEDWGGSGLESIKTTATAGLAFLYHDIAHGPRTYETAENIRAVLAGNTNRDHVMAIVTPNGLNRPLYIKDDIFAPHPQQHDNIDAAVKSMKVDHTGSVGTVGAVLLAARTPLN